MSLIDKTDPRVEQYRERMEAAMRANPMGLQPDESVEAWRKRTGHK